MPLPTRSRVGRGGDDLIGKRKRFITIVCRLASHAHVSSASSRVPAIRRSAVACEQALPGALAAGRKRKESFPLTFTNPAAPETPGELSCRLSLLKRADENAD